jgi:hypothetical protein
VASRFSVNDSDLQRKLEVMLKGYCERCECLGPERADFAEFTKVPAIPRRFITTSLPPMNRPFSTETNHTPTLKSALIT